MTVDEAVNQSVRRRGILKCYHFTPLPYLANVIRREGLWCRERLTQWGDAFDDDTGKWGFREKAHAFRGYVCCSVRPPLGMLKKERRPVILELHPRVLCGSDVAFIGQWSSFADVTPEQALRQTGVEWFDAMFPNAMTGFPTRHPGEFLVPRHIPLELIHRIVFHSTEDFDEAKPSLISAGKPEVIRGLRVAIDRYPFGRNME